CRFDVAGKLKKTDAGMGRRRHPREWEACVSHTIQFYASSFFFKRRRTRTTSGKPRPARSSDAGSGVAFVGGSSPEPPGPSVGVIVTMAWIEPGAPPGWPGGVKLEIATEYLRQPTSSAPRTMSAEVDVVQELPPGRKLALVALVP